MKLVYDENEWMFECSFMNLVIKLNLMALMIISGEVFCMS